MSTERKKIFLQKKRSLTFNPKDTNNNLKHKKSSKGQLTKGPWTSEENKLLIEWINQNGTKNWTKCALGIPGRSGKQCREHWNNSLNSEIIKGNWSSEEDFLIMKFYRKFNGSWKKMIPIFKSRTENSIKNRFYSQLRKIASKYIKTGKKEYSTKFGLDTLLKYLDMGLEEEQKKYLKEHPMSDNELEEYINKIENMVKNKPKGKKFIDLDISNKNKNNINDNDNNTNANINDENNINDKNIDINESEDEFNESLKKFSKKVENLETIKKVKKSAKNEEKEEKKKQTNNTEEWKTYEETFQIIIKDDKDKPKTNEKNNNIEEKNNKNMSEKKNEIPNNNNDYVSNNNNDKNNFSSGNNSNNVVNNNYYNIHNTFNYNINNNNFNNTLYNKNNTFGMNNMNNISDNNTNIAANITNNNNYNNNYNSLYSLSNQRNNSGIFKQFNSLLTKKSSDLSEQIKNNDHKAIENKYQNISTQYVFKLLNGYNNTSYDYSMNQNYPDPNYYMRLQSGKLNPLTPTPSCMFDRKFQYQNDYINNYNNYSGYLSQRSESYDFKNYIQNVPMNSMNSFGFNKMTSFNSINTNDDCNKKY